MMRKQTTILIAILALVIGGVSMLASEGELVAYAAPQLQETARPTPTNEPTNTPQEPTNTPEGPTNTPEEPTNTPEEPTNTPEEPTNTPEEPTNTPEEPTDTPVPPTNEPKPTSKPKKKSEPSSSSDPTAPPPPAPTAMAASDKIPATGFGSVGGWTLGITGLLLVCVLVIARRLRLGKGSEKGNGNADSQLTDHRHSKE